MCLVLEVAIFNWQQDFAGGEKNTIVFEVIALYSHRPKQKSPTRTIDGQVYLRVMIKTHRIMPGEDFAALLKRYCAGSLQPGDTVFVSQRAISTAEGGRSVDLAAWCLAISRGLGVQVCVVSANASGHGAVVAHSAGVDTKLMRKILLDNPLGEEGTLTPIGIVRKGDD